MALDDNISALATAIGAEIKDVRADMALISGGGGIQNVFIQETQPNAVVDSLWIQKNLDGSITFNLIEV